MNIEQAERKRDLRLRRRMLMLMHAARAGQGWMSGRFMMDVIDGSLPLLQGFADDAHTLSLLRDLIAGEFVEERDDRRKTRQPAGLDFSSYRITHRGIALIEQQIEPDPLVEDDRVRRPQL